MKKISIYNPNGWNHPNHGSFKDSKYSKMKSYTKVYVIHNPVESFFEKVIDFLFGI